MPSCGTNPAEQFVVSTKVGRILRPWTTPQYERRHRGASVDPPDFEVRFDYSYGGVVRAWEDSLQRLGLARVDLLLIHDLDRIYFPHGADYDAHLAQLVTGGYQALRDLRADGRIKAIGCGVNIPGQIPQFLDLFDLDFFLVAGPYTLLEQTTLDTELERCRLSGVSLVIGAAFCYGILATGTKAYTGNGPVVLGEDELEKAKRIEQVCQKLGVPLAAAAIQFPYGHPSVRSVLFGAVDGDQVRQTVEQPEAPGARRTVGNPASGGPAGGERSDAIRYLKAVLRPVLDTIGRPAVVGALVANDVAFQPFDASTDDIELVSRTRSEGGDLDANCPNLLWLSPHWQRFHRTVYSWVSVANSRRSRP